MATDIAFTLGALAILGTRVPFALKVFVTAVAIVDDLIAVGVIALFYSSDVNPVALTVALGLVAAIWLAGRAGVRRPWFYLLVGVPVWLAVLHSGLHATLAGVLVALAVPALRPLRNEEVVEQVEGILGAYASPEPGESAAAAEERRQSALRALEAVTEAAESPLEKLEHMLETPVNYLIVPVFALANAGVHLSAGALGGVAGRVALGIALGLVIGKPLGLFLASRLAVRSGLARLPDGVAWRQMLGGGILAGIGFTMAIFIANLAFPAEPEMLDAAKVAILAASAVAGLAGVAFFLREPAGVGGDAGEKRM
jgi:NhaA family Na+:H+ antiporter